MKEDKSSSARDEQGASSLKIGLALRASVLALDVYMERVGASSNNTVHPKRQRPHDKDQRVYLSRSLHRNIRFATKAITSPRLCAFARREPTASQLFNDGPCHAHPSTQLEHDGRTNQRHQEKESSPRTRPGRRCAPDQETKSPASNKERVAKHVKDKVQEG